MCLIQRQIQKPSWFHQFHICICSNPIWNLGQSSSNFTFRSPCFAAMNQLQCFNSSSNYRFLLLLLSANYVFMLLYFDFKILSAYFKLNYWRLPELGSHAINVNWWAHKKVDYCLEVQEHLKPHMKGDYTTNPSILYSSSMIQLQYYYCLYQHLQPECSSEKTINSTTGFGQLCCLFDRHLNLLLFLSHRSNW